jgi:hypothetical protein
MKLLLTSIELEGEFIRLMKHYKSFKWTAAWAGIDSSVYKELSNQEAKIDQLIIGLHFYQTHPDFIERFLPNKRVKYIKQPSGTFHPKLYLFLNSDSDWEMIIGSANFTKQAFSVNTEASILLSSQENGSSKILKASLKLIEDCWKKSTVFGKGEFNDYKVMWAIQKPKLKSLSGKIDDKPATPFHQIQFMVLDWNHFIKKIKKEHNHTLKDRLEMLATARELFTDTEHFSDFTLEQRCFIAGIPHSYRNEKFDKWPCFGSMKGHGVYKNRIINNDLYISQALDEIPLFGEITEEHFNRYKERFKEVFKGNSIASFSRLLAMKRPDIFYCITSANKKAFCKGYSVTYSHINYETYWELILFKIINSEWWLHPKPKSNTESQISNTRAAFIDAFCYQA